MNQQKGGFVRTQRTPPRSASGDSTVLGTCWIILAISEVTVQGL